MIAYGTVSLPVGLRWSTQRSMPLHLPILRQHCCPSLPHASLIMKKNIILVEQVLNGCRITSSGTRAKGRADPAIWECLCDLCTCILQFGKDVYVLYKQPYRMRDTAETGRVHIYSSPLPSQPLGSLWVVVRSHCDVCSVGAASRLAIWKHIKLNLQKGGALCYRLCYAVPRLWKSWEKKK